MAYRGECLCGAIQYKVDRLQPKMAHCHCSMCRKFHGASFASYGEARQEDFHWLSGKDYISEYQAPNGTLRQFCRQCGSSLTFAPSNDEGRFVEFSLGTLIDDIEERPDAHIFVGSKANWVNISDDLPCYQEGRNSKKCS